jgi:hypothetical protein
MRLTRFAEYDCIPVAKVAISEGSFCLLSIGADRRSSAQQLPGDLPGSAGNSGEGNAKRDDVAGEEKCPFTKIARLDVLHARPDYQNSGRSPEQRDFSVQSRRLANFLLPTSDFRLPTSYFLPSSNF